MALAYINGRIFTVDPQKPWGEGFIVDEPGRFASIGTDEEICATAIREGYVVWNLHGRFVMPGIHDAHTHLLGAATEQLSEALIGTNSDYLNLRPSIKTASCHCEYAHTLGEWIVAGFYSAMQFPDGKDFTHPRLRCLALVVARSGCLGSHKQAQNRIQRALDMEIIRAITIEDAKAVGREHKLGGILSGKLVNFISVDRDLTQGNFADAKVLEIWLRGTSV